LRRAEGGATIFGVFPVKNHDFTPKNLIFSNFRGVAHATPWIRPWDITGFVFRMSTHAKKTFYPTLAASFVSIVLHLILVFFIEP
jgi:hypothetical protein